MSIICQLMLMECYLRPNQFVFKDNDLPVNTESQFFAYFHVNSRLSKISKQKTDTRIQKKDKQ